MYPNQQFLCGMGWIQQTDGHGAEASMVEVTLCPPTVVLGKQLRLNSGCVCISLHLTRLSARYAA